MEDQQKFAVPLNTVTETLFYNHRLLIDSKLYNEDAQPRAWLISKINRIAPNGICMVTMAQDLYDNHRDYIERDADGYVIGMWADYFNSEISPMPIIPDDGDEPASITATVTCSGKPHVRIGGSAKTLTVKYFEDGEPIESFATDGWAVLIGDTLVSNTLWTITPIQDQYEKYKFVFLGDDSYIGKVLTVQALSGEVKASVDIEVLPL